MRLRLAPRRDVVCRAGRRAGDRLPGGHPRARRSPPVRQAPGRACLHCTEYLAQMRATIALTGQITPDDLSPVMRTEFIELYQRWRADQSGDAD